MRRRLIAPFIAAALLLAGCGASGGEAADTDGASSATTEADGGSKAAGPEVTTEELEALFPEASEIGPDYGEPEIEYGSDPDDADDEAEEEEDDETDKALKEQCPKAAELDFLDAPSLSDDEVSAKYSTERDQEIEITLMPTTGPITEENLEKIVEAWNDCGIVTIEDEDSGSMEMDLGAEPLEDIGDYGASISMNAEFELFGAPLSLDFRGYLFVVNGVAVSVTAASGLDDSMEPAPVPDELLEPVAKLMEERVQALTD